MLTILAFIVILGLLVFVHELGHFLMAKRMGIAVEEFGFGFPPRLFGIKHRETIYSLNWIPLGGFVRIKGIADDEKDGLRMQDSDSFATKKIWQRMLVVSAGVLMNIVLAAVLLSIGFGTGIPTVIDDAQTLDGRFRNPKIQIMEVMPDFPAKEAGLNAGDELLTLNDTPIETVGQVRELQEQAGDQPLDLSIRRGDEILNLSVPTKFSQEAERPLLGVSLVRTATLSVPWPEAIGRGALTSFSLLYQILLAFGNLLRNLIVEQQVPADVAGPVGVAVLTGQVVRQGFIYLIQFTALLSLNLALINFLPIPALDGGRFFFLFIEKLRGRPLNQSTEGRVHKIGFAFLLLLILTVTFRDVAQFKDSIFDFFSNLF